MLAWRLSALRYSLVQCRPSYAIASTTRKFHRCEAVAREEEPDDYSKYEEAYTDVAPFQPKSGSSLYEKLFANPTANRQKRRRPVTEAALRAALPHRAGKWATAKAGSGKRGPEISQAEQLRSLIIKELNAFKWAEILPIKKTPEEDVEEPSSTSPEWGGCYVRSWEAGGGRLQAVEEQTSAAEKQDATCQGPTALILNGASTSLLPTDFYRLACKGSNVDGWTDSIIKVIQTRDTTAQQALGQYAILFETRASALFYREELVRRMHLARHALQLKNQSILAHGPAGHLPPSSVLDTDSPTVDGDDIAAADIRAFTLLPPSAHVNTRLVSLDKVSSDHTTASRDSTSSAQEVERVRLHSAYSEAHSAMPDQCGRVFVMLLGGLLNVEAVKDALTQDGVARNLTWRLQEGANKAIEPITDRAGRDDRSNQDTGPPRFNRFLLSFADMVEARRFVRTWHKREIVDVGRRKSMVVNASVSW